MKYRIQFDILLSAWIKIEIFFIFYTDIYVEMMLNFIFEIYPSCNKTNPKPVIPGPEHPFRKLQALCRNCPLKKKNSFYTMIPTGRFSSSTLELYGPESTWEPMNSTKIFHILTWALCIAEFFCTSISLLD